MRNSKFVIGFIMIIIGFLSLIIASMRSLLIRVGDPNMTEFRFITEHPENILICIVCVIVIYIGVKLLQK